MHKQLRRVLAELADDVGRRLREAGKYAGVALRAAGDPVLFLKDAPGISRDTRRQMLDGLNALNQRTFNAIGDM